MQAKPIVALFSDSHLQNRAWPYRDIEGDSYYSFTQLVDVSIKIAVEMVIGAGDLIDTQLNKSDPIVFLHQQLDRLEKAKVRFGFTQGQHELADKPWFSGHRWAEHLHSFMTNVAGVNVYGLDFTPSPMLQTALAAIPADADVLIAHQVWSENMGSVASPQGNMGDVPSVHTVFTGDYHVYKKLETRGLDGQPLTMYSPGSCCMQSIDEPIDKFFLVMYDDLTFKRVPLKTRRRLEWSFSHPGDVDTILQTMDIDLQRVMDETVGYDECVRKPLVWIDYPHRLAQHCARIEKALARRGHLFWKEHPREPSPETVERQRQRQAAKPGERIAATLEGELPAFLASIEKTHLCSDCERLLAAGDVEGELRRMREEALQ